MERYMIQIFGEIDITMADRIHEEFNYYMYDTKTEKEIFYYKIYEKTIILIVNDTSEWSYNNVQKFLRVVFRDINYIFSKVVTDNYNGWQDNSFWEALIGEKANELFDKPKQFRKSYHRQKKLNKLKKMVLGKTYEDENIELREKTE